MLLRPLRQRAPRDLVPANTVIPDKMRLMKRQNKNELEAERSVRSEAYGLEDEALAATKLSPRVALVSTKHSSSSANRSSVIMSWPVRVGLDAVVCLSSSHLTALSTWKLSQRDSQGVHKRQVCYRVGEIKLA